MPLRILRTALAGAARALFAVAPGRAEEAAADAAAAATNVFELARVGDGTNQALAFPGFGVSTVIASSYSVDAAAGALSNTLAVGSFSAELRRVAPEWKAVRALLPAPVPADEVAVRKLVWSGVSAWMVDMTLAAGAHKGIAGLRQRHLVAPLESGFLVLSFRGPADRFEADRPAMRRAALAVRFRVNGLIAEFFSSPDLEWLACRQVDPNIDFDWGLKGPVNGVGPEFFSIRWTGKVKPLYSETYTFTTASDDGVRLWVNGQPIVENWTVHPVTEDSGTIALKAGEPVEVKMEWYQNEKHAVARLLWESATQVREPVPAACFSADPPPGFAPAAEIGGGNIDVAGGWPTLAYGDLPGGYAAGDPAGMKWQGKRPAQTLAIGEGTNAVQVSLQAVHVSPANARTVLPASSPKDRVEAQSVVWRYAPGGAAKPASKTDTTMSLWRYASMWSVDVTLDAASHPETRLLYRRYYLAPMKRDLLVFSFASQDAGWRKTRLDEFRKVFDSVSLTVEEVKLDRPEADDSVF